MKITTKYITRAAIIAAIYCALNIAVAITPLGYLSYGPVQIRVSEAMTVLPAIIPAAIPGLFIGCLLSNIIGVAFGLGGGMLDVIFGSLATLVAAFLSYKLRDKKYLVPLPPVIINALVVGSILSYVLNWPLGYAILAVGAGQAIACYVLGLPLLSAMKKNKAFQ